MWPINRIQIQESANAERKNHSRKQERSKAQREKSIEIEITPKRTMAAMGVGIVQSWRLQPTLFSSWTRLTRVREAFSIEIEALQKEKVLPKNSKLVGLHPSLHDDRLLDQMDACNNLNSFHSMFVFQ